MYKDFDVRTDVIRLLIRRGELFQGGSKSYIVIVFLDTVVVEQPICSS